jgi:tetratricopeptide (TPR) repeat protein
MMHLTLALTLTSWLALGGARSDEGSWQAEAEAGSKALRAGQYAEAERAFAAALQLAEGFGENDARLPQSLLNLARVRLKQGRYAEADRLCARAQPLLVKIHGAQHAEVARCLNLNAEVCGRLGLIGEGNDLARMALAMRQKVLGKEHPDTAESLTTLATLGDANRARESLNIQERVLGKEHPDLVANLLALAQIGYPNRAEPYVRRAIDLVKKTHGEGHPDMAECLTLLATIQTEQGQYEEAEKAQQKALAIWKERLSPDTPRAAVGLYGLAMIRLGQKRAAEAEDLFHQALRLQCSTLTDEELCQYGARADGPRGGLSFYRTGAPLLTQREAYLAEMVRRGGKRIEAFLVRALNEEPGSRLDKSKERPANLELLTALRRVQKKSEPLRIVVRGGINREAIFPRMPEFAVALTNVDEAERPVRFQDGGNYRSGRQARWRFEVRDAKGQLLVPEEPTGLDGEGGGLSTEGKLEYDHSWDTTLDMNRFAPLPPGEYTVRILYHDRLTIADLPTICGLIVCQSEPIRLLVQPRLIDLTRRERAEAETWLGKLDEQAPLRILAGTYGSYAHQFIAPQSPPGKLLALGWKAVPTLLDELDKEKLTPRRRAWVLALLFSITSWHSPRGESGVLPDYQFQEAGWQVWGGRDGRNDSGGFGTGGAGEVSGARINEDAQKAFARRWQGFREFIVVRER